MKFTIERDELLRGLGRIQAIVERRGTLPILSNALIQAHEKGVTLAATDLEVGVIATLAAEVEESGEVTLPAKTLYEITREFEAPDVAFQVVDGARVQIDSGEARFTLLSISPEEYPSIPGSEGVALFPIESGLLGELIDRTLYATSTDETRYNLNGVLMETAEEGRLRCIATDGHRLAKIDRSLPERLTFLEKPIIVPRKGVGEIRKLTDDVDERVEIGLGEGFLIVRRPGLLLSCRLIDGEFPNYRQVIPGEFQVRLVIERERLLAAVRRIALMTYERAHGFKFTLEGGQLELSVSNPDMGEARERLPVQYDGERFATSFSARYVQDALAAMSAKEVAVELVDELTAAVLRPADDPDQLAVVAPMRI
jgi:DNA polymerase-3 subunit beta